MTTLQKAIMTEIKARINEREFLLKHLAKGIKFHDMGRYIKEGYREFTECCDGSTMAKYLVRTTFKPEFKYDDNVADWMVNIYSDGSVGVYFDGTEYIEIKG